MKRKLLAGMAIITVLGLNGCGKTELALVSEQIEVELGADLSENVADYVKLDEKSASEAAVDFSSVDLMKTGTYTAAVTYGEQTVRFEVVVKDTTAPAAEVNDTVKVAVGMPLTVKDVLKSVTELSGSVETGFEEREEAKGAGEQTEAEEGTETATEQTETAEGTEAVGTSTEMAESTEEAGLHPEENFLIGDVECRDAAVIFEETGEYDILLVIADASGNETKFPVHVIVGAAPEFKGIEDITITVGEADIDYLDGVTALDCDGKDLTDQIVCDTAAVNTGVAGEYSITYTVSDTNGFKATEKAVVTVREGSTKKKSAKVSSGADSKSAKNNESGKNSETDQKKSSGKSVSGTNDSSKNNNGSTGSGSTSNGSDAGSTSNGNGSNGGSQPTTSSTGGGNNSGSTLNGSGSQSVTPPANDGGSNSGGNSNGGGSQPSAPAPAPTPEPSPAPDAGSGSQPTTPPVDEPMQVPDDFTDDFAGGEIGGADDGSPSFGTWE